MSGRADPAENLIAELSSQLRPVRRLRPPALRLCGWLVLPILLGLLLWAIAPDDVNALPARLFGAPDMWLAELGEIATAVLGGLAAFQLCLPERSDRWAWAPLPGVLLWVGASGLGCLRADIIPGTTTLSAEEATQCLALIITFSLPISLLLGVMLRRATPLRPGLVALTGGIAAAAAAAVLLSLVHPVDATASDLSMHGAAVLLVVLVNRLAGGRLLARN